jgi:hypothetical protein
MTLKLALLVLALGFALVLAAIDFRVWDVDGNQHLPGLLGLSLAAFFGHLLAPNR